MKILDYIEKTVAKAAGEDGSYVKESPLDYIREAELHGHHVFWHGSVNFENNKMPHKIETENAQNIGKHPCFFFTTHFGYAIAYVYPDKADVEKTDDSLKRAVVYKPHSKFFNKLAMDSNLIKGTDSWSGWVYPLSLPAGTNIFIAGSLGDKRILQEMIANSKYKSFYPNEQKFLELFGRLAKEDWFFLDYEKEKYGFNRRELLDFLEHFSSGSDGYAGFYGFHNFETENKLSSIGLFKGSVSLLNVGKPFKVMYDNGHILISENY